MRPPPVLGEFEQVVLLGVVALDDGAYAVPIRDVIRRHAGRTVSRGALYITLERLERKGYLSSTLGDPLPVRGGRARRYYRATPGGVSVLRRARLAHDRLWSAAAASLGKA